MQINTYAEILNAGGNLRIDAGRLSLPDIVELAKRSGVTGSSLVLYNLPKLTPDVLMDLAKAARGHLTLEIG